MRSWICASPNIPSICGLEPKPGEHSFPMVNGGGPSKDSATLIRLDVDRKRIHLTVTRGDGEVLQQRDYLSRAMKESP